MKTITLKKTLHVALFLIVVASTLIITKTTIKDVKYLYGSEKDSTTILTCFCDMIH